MSKQGNGYRRDYARLTSFIPRNTTTSSDGRTVLSASRLKNLGRCGSRSAQGQIGSGKGLTVAEAVEILRLLHGGAMHQVIDLDLQGVEHRSAVPQSLAFSGLNPGYIDVRGRSVVDR